MQFYTVTMTTSYACFSQNVTTVKSTMWSWCY